MELADDIAYAVHDLEDAIATEVLTFADWQNHALIQLQELNSPWLTTHLSAITARLFSHHEYERKDAIGELVNTFIIHASLEVQNNNSNQILQYTVSLPDDFQNTQCAQTICIQAFIREPKMQQVEFKGQNLLIELFSAFASDPMRLLPETTQEMWLNAHNNNGNAMRVICEYLSGMSDEYAYKTYQRLFLPSA